MEYFPGKNLRQAFFDNKKFKFTIPKKHSISQQMVSGLSYLHECKILQRDFKPENILINEQMDLKIIDFGLSKVIEEGVDATSEYFSIRTPRYMAPEIFFHRQTYTQAADVWSLGCTMYEVYVRKTVWSKEIPPTPGGMDKFKLVNVLENNNMLPSHLDSIPANVSPWIKPCFDRDPNKRPTAQKILNFYETLLFVK